MELITPRSYLLALSSYKTPGGDRANMRDFRHLDAWHKSHAFTLHTFKATEEFPKSEAFGLAANIRRGAASFTMRIAEACGQDTQADFVHGLSRARAAGMELEYSLLLARDLEFMKPDLYDALCSQLLEVRRMLSGLMKSANSPAPENARQ